MQDIGASSKVDCQANRRAETWQVHTWFSEHLFGGLRTGWTQLAPLGVELRPVPGSHIPARDFRSSGAGGQGTCPSIGPPATPPEGLRPESMHPCCALHARQVTFIPPHNSAKDALSYLLGEETEWGERKGSQSKVTQDLNENLTPWP